MGCAGINLSVPVRETLLGVYQPLI